MPTESSRNRRLPSLSGMLAAATFFAALAAPAMCAPAPSDAQQVFEARIRPFVQAHCVKCHGEQTTRAGFRIDTLGTDFLADKTADHWKEVYDNLGLGNMPPKDEPRPAIADVQVVMTWIDQEIRAAERRAKSSAGRTRRLNRTEYFNTLRDLFHLDENYVRSLEEELPPDGKTDGFDRVGASLYIDQSQLAKYFALAERVLAREVFAPRPKPTQPVKDFARDIKWGRENRDGQFTNVWATGPFGELFFPPNMVHKTIAELPTGARIYELKNGGIEYLCGGWNAPLGNHHFNGIGGAGGGFWSSKVGNFIFRIQEEGTYRMRFRAGAFAGRDKYAVENVKLLFEFGKGGEQANLDRGTLVIDAPLEEPKDYVLEIYLHPRPEVAGSNMGRLYWNGIPAAAQEVIRGVVTQTGMILRVPELDKLEAGIVQEHYSTMYAEKKKGTSAEKLNELLKSRHAEANEKHERAVQEYVQAGKPAFVYNPDYDLTAVPRLWLESWEIEGPIVEWPSRARKELLFDGDERPLDAAYVREIFARFLPRAYRRSVTVAEIEDWVAWVQDARARHELSELEAFQMGLKAILCSPGFLLIEESTTESDRPQPLTDFELASRLSYFLWSTMPDEQLLGLAAADRLHEPAVLSAQVGRMLADPRSTGLVTNFTGQWLQARDFGKTMTDRNEFRMYTDELRKSSWQEPYEFFREILRADLSILNFLDSDFVVVDKVLARHYGIEGVKEADGFTRVAIGPEHHRGGVLGMAGVLTYLSDGFRTLPVRRAAYVVDTLWNDPAKPPPPNAGDLPAVKGTKLTVRQRLEQHRNNPSCASCHNHLDPFGVALENYDAIGRWRERQTGEGLKGDDKSPPLDVSGMLPSGRSFDNVQQYKQALLAEKERFVRGFSQKLLTYALGRSVGATDRTTVDGIVAKAEDDGYRMQSLIQAVVASEAFRMK